MPSVKTKFLLPLFFAFLAFLLSGCISINQPQVGPSGALGIYKTIDATLTWQPKSALLNAESKPLSIADVSVNRMIMDPTDHNALYIATDKGLFYSYTAADSWQQVPLFGSANIRDVAVDYFDKCNIFVAAGQSIYKSADCLRTWQEVYFDSRQGLQITVVATENYNKNIVYAANNQGEVLKSYDYGKNWQVIKRVNNPIKQLLIDKDDTRIIYVATEIAGIFKTTDGGKTWSDEKPETDLNQGLNQFPDARVFNLLVQDISKKDTLILVTKYGLLRTTNGGAKWESIELITPERSANIYSLAIDPKDNRILYYGTDTTLYKSVDDGKNWQTQKPPTIGAVNVLLIDPQNSKVIYLGGKAIKK